MVKITEELIRKKSEHNECIIGTLEELSLHQEDVEKIEHIQNWCKDLEILYLQANLISKIENLNKLKKLKYLNLAINNIEKIENLHRCESLEKLDLTLNFIGDLESVCSLKHNNNLRELYLTGNPCAEFDGYRDFVIAQLLQLSSLDNVAITRSERIKAKQILPEVMIKIQSCQNKYKLFRSLQKEKLANSNDDLDDETFWKSPSENAPETRIQIAKRTKKSKDKKIDFAPSDKNEIQRFNKDGRPFNINQAKVEFKFDDNDPDVLSLDISVYKFLDSNYLDVDIEPNFVKVLIKEKMFQYVLPEEICVHASKAQRSQVTGHLLITMPRVNYDKHKITRKSNVSKKEVVKNNYLEVGTNDDMDFSNIVGSNIDKKKEHEYSDMPPLEFI